MSKQYLVIGLLLVSGILLLSIGEVDTFSSEVVSTDDFPFVGLRMVYIGEDGYNETFVVSDENATHYFVEIYADGTLLDTSVISKEVTGTRTYSWYMPSYSQDIGGWVCWIDISNAAVGDFVSIGNEFMFNITEHTTYSTNSTIYDVWVVKPNETSAAYYFDTNYGALVGYFDGGVFHDLVESNIDLTIPPREYHPFAPAAGTRLTWLSDTGYNETVVVTGNDSTYYNVDIYTDEELVGSSQITRALYSEHCYYFVAYDTEWAGWIDPTGLSIGQTLRPSGEVFNITALDLFTTPLGTFEVWVANGSGLTYFYEIDTGIMVGYDSGSFMHYLTYFNGDELVNTTTTTMITTTSVPTTTIPTTTIPITTTTTIITTVITTTPESSTTNEESSTTNDSTMSTGESMDTTTDESSDAETSDTTAGTITPGFTIFSFIALGGILFLRKRLR